MKQIAKENDGQVSPKVNEANETREEVQSDPKYGPRMVVSRRKSTNKVGRASGPTNTNQVAQLKLKGNSDLSQTRALEAEGENLEKSNPSDLADLRTENTHIVVAQNPQLTLGMEKDCVMEESKDYSNKDFLQGPRQHFEGKGKALLKNKSKGNKGLGIKGTKNLKSSKSQSQLTFSSGDKGSQLEYGRAFGRDDLNAKNGVGHVVQEQSDCDSRQDNSPDKGGADRNFRLV